MTDALWLARRAVLAIALMVAFYLLALAIMAGLLLVPYAEWTYLHRVEPRIALACIGTALALAAAVIPRPDRFEAPGPRLDQATHPKLFSTIRSVAEATGQEMPEEVYLVNDVNAWVSHRGGTMGVGSRRVMGIGLPLMLGLSVGELRAVLAHEFGHYSAGDVKLGPWIYKTRVAIARAMASLRETWLSGIFNAYGRLFMRLTLAISREQEFLADALAARTVHPSMMASALRRTGGLAPAFAAYWKFEVGPALEAGFLPPIGSGFAQYLGSAQISEAMDRSVTTEIAEHEPSAFDSHPPLRERLGALAGVHAPPPQGSDDLPATSLLEDVDAHARQLLTFLAGAETTGRLRAVTWDQLAQDVYPANWRKVVARFRDVLRPYTADAPPTDRKVYADLGSKLPGGGTRSSEERIKMACGVFAAAVALALLRAGATLDTRPGQPPVFRRGDSSLNPFSEVPRLISGELTPGQWQAQCLAMGVAGQALVPDGP